MNGYSYQLPISRIIQTAFLNIYAANLLDRAEITASSSFSENSDADYGPQNILLQDNSSWGPEAADPAEIFCSI